MKIKLRSLIFFVVLFLITGAQMYAQTASTTHTQDPIIILTGIEPFTTSGKDFIRYKFSVFNGSAFPAQMFAPAPELPPCGSNTKSSRSWVDIYDQRGKRLNGFCALTGPNALSEVWFALEKDVIPPSWVYIEINDRATSTKYKSNLAETTL